MSRTTERRVAFWRQANGLDHPDCPSEDHPDFDRLYTLHVMRMEELNPADYSAGTCADCGTRDVPLSGGLCIRCRRGQQG